MVFRAITRFPVQQLRSEMDRLLTGFFGEGAGPWPRAADRNAPAVNLWEEEDAVKAELEVPGVNTDQIDISVAGGELTVQYSYPQLEEGAVTYHRRERPSGQFSRSLRLPVEVDAARVEASLKDGVLTITLPKAEAARPRKIKVVAQGQ